MKGIATLIKLHKRTLDELRRRMTGLENQKAQLLRLSAKLQDELETEIKLAKKQTEMARFFGDFAGRIQKRQEDIAREIRGIDKQMAQLAEKIAEAFGEVKKYEIAQENAKKRAEAEERRKETIMLDEVAGQQHRRKHQDA